LTQERRFVTRLTVILLKARGAFVVQHGRCAGDGNAGQIGARSDAIAVVSTSTRYARCSSGICPQSTWNAGSGSGLILAASFVEREPPEIAVPCWCAICQGPVAWGWQCSTVVTLPGPDSRWAFILGRQRPAQLQSCGSSIRLSLMKPVVALDRKYRPIWLWCHCGSLPCVATLLCMER
jgi:hypothetical protein